MKDAKGHGSGPREDAREAMGSKLKTVSDINQAKRTALASGGPGMKPAEWAFARKYVGELRAKHSALGAERMKASLMRNEA
jgi:hypothetical protein